MMAKKKTKNTSKEISKSNIVWSLLRISLGWIFFWAFIDKLFGLGFATQSEQAWLAGGSPTAGFLQFATKGPLLTVYQSLAGSAFVDVLFMLGLLLIGLALISGVGVRIAGYSGALLMTLMYTAGFLPPEHNPLIDEHMIYGIILLGLAFCKVGDLWGFGRWWSSQKMVKKYPILR
jgi:thiosulfate dehydrogenase (quinone) large subunit